MSAQAYTNRRRVLAEASVLKVQYKKGVAVNNRSIYATINCIPNFEQLSYTPACFCPFNGRGFTPITPALPPSCNISAIDGGNSGTGIENVSLWIDGGNANTLSTTCWFDGGNSGDSGYYDGGNAFSDPIVSIDGGTA
jgi:hypothetical protein